MPTTAIYLRQSYAPNGDVLAITRQRADVTKLCAARGWTTTTEYVDNDFSATNGRQRPAYTRMLADIKAGAVDAVAVWDLDRLYRQPRELEDLIELADQRGLLLATVTGDADLSTDNGRLFARIKGAVGKSEVERKSARQKAANRQARASGRWNRAGMRKFGYTKDGRPLEPEATMFRDAATAVLAGKSLRSIATEWNRRGVTTVPGSRWTSLQVRRMLINPLYAALVTYKGKVVGDGAWEALIGRDIHDGLVAFLSDPSRRPAVSFERRHMGSGVYLCGLCGQPLSAVYPSGRRRGVSYSCRPSSHVARRGEPLDAYVEMLVLERLMQYRGELQARMSADAGVDVDGLNAKRVGLQARLDELAAMFAEGAIDASQLRRGTTDLRAQLAGIDQVLAEAARTSPVADLLAAGDAVVDRWAALTPDLKGKIIGELMTVTVLPNAPRGPGFRPEYIGIAWR